MKLSCRLDKISDILFNSLESGKSIKESCEIAGVPRSTFYNWLKVANSPDASPPLAEFYSEFQEAVGQKEIHSMERIDKIDQKLDNIQENISEFKVDTQENISEFKVDIQNNINEFKILFTEHKSQTQVLNEGIKALLETSTSLDGRVDKLEAYQLSQKAINDATEKSLKHRWTKIVGVVLIFEAIGIGLGILLTHIL